LNINIFFFFYTFIICPVLIFQKLKILEAFTKFLLSGALSEAYALSQSSAPITSASSTPSSQSKTVFKSELPFIFTKSFNNFMGVLEELEKSEKAEDISLTFFSFSLIRKIRGIFFNFHYIYF
jgi:hypothetical protein